MKIPFLTAVIIVINPRRFELVQEVLEKAVTITQQYLENGAWREVKLILRFLGCLQGVLASDGVFPVLEELFSRAVDLQTASSEDVSNVDVVLYQILISVFSEPWLGACENHLAYNSIRYGIFSHGF